MKHTFLSRRLAAFVTALALTFALTGCGAAGGGSADAVGSTESTSAEAHGGASGGGVPHLDPGNATAENARKIIYTAMELESTDFDAAQHRRAGGGGNPRRLSGPLRPERQRRGPEPLPAPDRAGAGGEVSEPADAAGGIRPTC